MLHGLVNHIASVDWQYQNTPKQSFKSLSKTTTPFQGSKSLQHLMFQKQVKAAELTASAVQHNLQRYPSVCTATEREEADWQSLQIF